MLLYISKIIVLFWPTVTAQSDRVVVRTSVTVFITECYRIAACMVEMFV